MALLRAAFERQDGVVELLVLCAGCYQEILPKIEHVRRWCRDLDGVSVCDFCLSEARESALR